MIPPKFSTGSRNSYLYFEVLNLEYEYRIIDIVVFLCAPPPGSIHGSIIINRSGGAQYQQAPIEAYR
eukprot:SAG31_NODE_508_length_14732_cov_75.624547_2_plen_67_part_00